MKTTLFNGASISFDSVLTNIYFSKVGQIVTSIHDKLWLIGHPQTRTGTLRILRTIALHHLAPVLSAILEFPLPLDE